MDTDKLLQAIGSHSRYQRMVFFMICFVTMRGVWHIIAVDFMGGPVPHHCDVPDFLPHLNKSTLETLQCQMYTDEYMNVTRECTSWTYESNHSLTITQQWNMVCGRNYLSELSSTIFMIGTASGALFISPLADRFGRKTVLLPCLWIQAVIGVVVPFIDSYIVFTVLRFLLGACNMAIGLVGYLLVTEVFPASSRTLPSIAIYIYWGIGIMVLSLMAYLLPDWKHLELCISLPSFLTIAFYWILPESLVWLLAKKKYAEARNVLKFVSKVNGKQLNLDDFTLKSTLTQNCDQTANTHDVKDREDTNFQTLHTENYPSVKCTLIDNVPNGNGEVNIAENLASEINTDANNMSNSNIHMKNEEMKNEIGCYEVVGADDAVADDAAADDKLVTNDSAKMKYSVLDLFRTRHMRMYTLTMFYLWLVNSLVYFGILFAIPTFHGNKYVNMCLSGVVEIPAYIICMVIVQTFGRRKPLFLFMILCGVSSLGYVFTPLKTASEYSLVWVKVTFAMLAKFAITGSYATIYLFSAEIYPTVIRNHGLGMSSFFENIGGIASPFIAYSAKSTPWLPMAISGGLTIVGGILSLVLPETHKRPLPETIEDVEGSKRKTDEHS